MSRVTLRRDALDDLEAYDLAVRRERAARSVAVDAAALYDAPPAEPEAPADEAEEETEEPT